MKKNIFISFLFYALKIIAADALESLNDTVEYLSQNIEDAAYKQISEQELREDLQFPKSVRYQIQKNLSLSERYTNSSNGFLMAPIICIGTGRNQKRLKQEHLSSTLIRKDDISIEKNPYFEPDIEVSDAFSLTDTLPILNNEQYGCVFSAHAGIGLLPFENPTEIGFSLKIYQIKLIHDGLFVYNSSVQTNKDIYLADLCRRFKKNDFTAVKGKITELFVELGFVDIDIFIKDESSIYGQNAFSVVIIAKKPRS